MQPRAVQMKLERRATNVFKSDALHFTHDA